MKVPVPLFALASLIVICATVLVALDKLDASLYIGAVIAPLTGGIAAALGVTKTVQGFAAVERRRRGGNP